MQLLVAVDLAHPVEPVLDLAVRAAHRLRAGVHLLTVVPLGREHGTFQPMDAGAGAAARPAGDTSGGLIPYPIGSALTEPRGVMVETRTQATVRALAEAQDRLATLARRFGDRPVMVVVLPDDDPAGAIAAHAREQRTDVVVMGTHARAGVRRAVLGSVAEAVVRDVPVPVLLAGPRYAATPATELSTLIVCLDGSPFSEAILPLAAWVRRLHMQVTVVGTATEDASSLPVDVREDSYVHGVAQTLRRHGVDAQWEVLHGPDPARAIADFATTQPGSVIALATHARVGLPRLLTGSVAMHVVHAATCPVLVLHPAAPRDEPPA